MSGAAWDALVARAVRAHVPAGDRIFAAGEAPRTAAVVAGIVRISAPASAGRTATLRYARSGDLVGLVPALAQSTRFAADAVTDVTLAMLSLRAVRAAAEKHPEIGWSLAQATAREVVSRVLAHFAQLGTVVTERGRIIVVDPAALGAIATERLERGR